MGAPSGDYSTYKTLSIASITPVGIQPVWDIEVEEDHSYVAQGLIHHNSSSDPVNLQNVINDPVYCIKEVFIHRPQMLLLVADYSQIELRVLAHFSEDPELMRAYFNNEDLHENTAKMLFPQYLQPDGKMPKLWRTRAKTINFGVWYGTGYKALAKRTGLREEDAKAYLKRYFDVYAKANEFRKSVIEFGLEKQYVTTLAGRRRHFPQIPGMRAQLKWYEDNKLSREPEAQVLSRKFANVVNAIFNTTIQGSAGDICKKGMIKAHPYLKKVNAWFLGQVHDEVIIEFPEKKQFEVRRIVQETFEHPFAQELRVPLVVNMNTCHNWNEGK